MSWNWSAIRPWLLVLILAASLAGVPAHAQGSATVRVEPAAQTVQVNDTVTASIKVDNIANLTAFEVHLSFDPNILEVTSLANGGFIPADFIAQNTFDNAAGTIDYAVAQMNRAPAQGSGSLLTIAFRAKAGGSSTLTTRSTPAAPGGLLLSDQDGVAIQASWQPGTITVGSPASNTSTPTSTPTSTSIANPPTNTSTSTPVTSTPTITSTSTPVTNTPTTTSTSAPVTSTPTSTPVAGTVVVRVEPASLKLPVNGTANLAIKVDNITSLIGFEIHLSFDPNILEVTGVTNGGFIAADIIAQQRIDNANGRIDYAIAQVNRLPARGSGTLLNIALRTEAAGTSTITTYATPAAPLGILLSDQNGNAIQSSWQPGSITVENAAVLGTHVVRFGEWLYCIARAYKVSPWAIADVNHLWWPNLIFPNQILTIPNVPWTNMIAGPVCRAQFTVPATPTPPPPTVTPPTPIITPVPTTVTPAPVTPVPTTVTPPTQAPPPGCRAIYIVRPGDNLYRIATWYGTSYAELARVNNIPNPRLIYPGQRLCIP